MGAFPVQSATGTGYVFIICGNIEDVKNKSESIQGRENNYVL